MVATRDTAGSIVLMVRVQRAAGPFVSCQWCNPNQSSASWLGQSELEGRRSRRGKRVPAVLRTAGVVQDLHQGAQLQSRAYV